MRCVISKPVTLALRLSVSLKTIFSVFAAYPNSGLQRAQKLTERVGDLVNYLRLIAGEQFDQAEKDSKSHRALASSQNKVSIAQRLHLCKYLLKRICYSKPLV
jgi:hypothetical protein